MRRLQRTIHLMHCEYPPRDERNDTEEVHLSPLKEPTSLAEIRQLIFRWLMLGEMNTTRGDEVA